MNQTEVVIGATYWFEHMYAIEPDCAVGITGIGPKWLHGTFLAETLGGDELLVFPEELSPYTGQDTEEV